MSGNDDRRTGTKGLHYHVSDLTDVDPLGLRSASCDVGLKHTVADYMTSIERKQYENQNLCRKNGMRVHRGKGYGVGDKIRLTRPTPPTPVVRKTLKDMAQEHFSTLDTDYVVTDLSTVTVETDPTESFLQLTTESGAQNVYDEHLYDTISGHYKKKGVNNGGTQKQDAYYLDIVDDYTQQAFPPSTCSSYDEIKCKTLSLSRHKNLPRNVYSTSNWEFLNRTKQLMMTQLLAKLPATRNRRVMTIFVATVLLLCSIWLVAAATKPKNTHGLIFPTQTHQLIGGRPTVFQAKVTFPEPTSSSPVLTETGCLQDCRDKVRAPLCGSDMLTYESKCDFRVAKCKDSHLFKLSNGSCELYKSDEMEDD